MKAAVYQGPEKIILQDVERPKIEHPRDAIVRITTSAICGSDLHLWHGRVPIPPGYTFSVGHEFVGVVEEVGSAIDTLKPGDRIVVAFNTCCGQCYYCRRGLYAQCELSNTFGFGRLNGGQAEYARVPFADSSAVKVPDDVSDDQAIFVGDIFSTGFFGAEQGGVKAGDTVVVIGCGPVGLFCQMSCHVMGAAQVIAVDSVAERLKVAKSLGSVPLNFQEEDAPAKVRELTGGRGADVVVEAVGQVPAFKSAFTYVRRGGTVSVIGMYIEPDVGVPLGQMFLQDLTLKVGVCNTRAYMERTMELIRHGKVDLAKVVSHTLPLDQVTHGYEIFADHKDNAVKVLLKP
jgi:2-desacetyl-2-hydroxyethyl bacteriochlorophyllide A dehydrogenase